MAGRKRIPDRLKVIRGTAQKSRMNPRAPKAKKELPEAPTWFNRREKQLFGVLVDRLDAMGYASSSYTEMLALTAAALAEWETLSKLIRKDGTQYETTNTNGDTAFRPVPAVAQRADAMRRAQSLLAEFGLGPSASGKVSVPKGDKDANPFAELLNG